MRKAKTVANSVKILFSTCDYILTRKEAQINVKASYKSLRQ